MILFTLFALYASSNHPDLNVICLFCLFSFSRSLSLALSLTPLSLRITVYQLATISF